MEFYLIIYSFMKINQHFKIQIKINQHKILTNPD
jgi:hypothetical protein